MNFYKKLTKNKNLEIEGLFLRPFYNYFQLNLYWSKRVDHAGVHLTISLFSLYLNLHIYDTRHWDWENDCWDKGE